MRKRTCMCARAPINKFMLVYACMRAGVRVCKGAGEMKWTGKVGKIRNVAKVTKVAKVGKVGLFDKRSGCFTG